MLVLLGWHLRLPLLTSWGAGLPASKPITAVCFLALGLALGCERRLPPWATSALSAAALCVAFSVLVEYAIRRDFGFQHLLLPEGADPGPGASPYHMGWTTAASFAMAGGALLLRTHRLSALVFTGAAIAIGNIAMFALFGFDGALTSIGLTSHSRPTAVGLLVLAVALAFRSPRPWPQISLRLALAGLVLAALLPALVLIASQARHASLDRLSAFENKASDISAQISRILNQFITEREKTLQTLAASPALKSVDLASFYEHAKAVASTPDSVLVVIDRDMRMLLSTLVPFGTRLPPVVDVETSRRAFESGHLEVSDVYRGPFSDMAVVATVLPVAGTGYQLRLTMSGLALSRMLQAAAQPGWALSVVDRNGMVVARSKDPERWIGKPIPASRFREISASPDGVMRGPALEGRPAFARFHRTRVGWTVVAVIEDASLATIFSGGYGLVSLGWILIACLGLGMATLAALAIGRPLARLSAAAEGIAAGVVSDWRHSQIREIDAVADALREAAVVRLASESEARRQELLFRSVFDGTPDCMVLTDLDRRILRVNPAFTRVFGFTAMEMIGGSARRLYAEEEEWQRMGRAYLDPGATVVASRSTFVRKDGSPFPAMITGIKLFDPNGVCIAYLGIIRDITVEQQREDALREKRHLEALGRLTGGIAHDFNNLLTIVSANLQLIDMRIDDDKCRHWLHNAEQATQMGARLNQRLMTFARQRRLAARVVDLNALIGANLDLLRRTVGESVEVVCHLAASPATVLVDVSEMESTVLNLALNARDAMPDGGRLTVGTANVALGESAAPGQSGARPGSYVRLMVADTGSGMTEAVRRQAFEPFFTTKEAGKGTGLGLTTIHGFILQSGGSILLESRPGGGTEATILLPLHDQPADKDAPATPVDLAAAPARGNGEVILLVEDNDGVRSATADLLQALGYDVLTASSGPAAISVVESGRHIDLVLSDVVMPGGLSGLDLARRLQARDPRTRILFISGFPDVDQRLAGELNRFRILPKPYSNEALQGAIRAALA